MSRNAFEELIAPDKQAPTPPPPPSPQQLWQQQEQERRQQGQQTQVQHGATLAPQLPVQHAGAAEEQPPALDEPLRAVQTVAAADDDEPA